MPPRVDQALIAEINGGDPLLTPAEAAAQLGVDVLELNDMHLPSVQPGGLRTGRRYRQSVITAKAAELGLLTPFTLPFLQGRVKGTPPHKEDTHG